MKGKPTYHIPILLLLEEHLLRFSHCEPHHLVLLRLPPTASPNQRANHLHRVPTLPTTLPTTLAARHMGQRRHGRSAAKHLPGVLLAGLRALRYSLVSIGDLTRVEARALDGGLVVFQVIEGLRVDAVIGGGMPVLLAVLFGLLHRAGEIVRGGIAFTVLPATIRGSTSGLTGHTVSTA